ncbi:MAG TPA: hypothetical protein VL651_01195 [Bacteroidia bacterium]|jgi:hypothetical protein|nr:hypothetical protein [Bacteroidia bacterium]
MRKMFFAFPIILLFSCMEKHSTPDTFLIPEDLHGHFAVVYGQKCGVEPTTENGRRILRIPDCGVLVIQPDFEEGIIDHEYYFVDVNGNRTKINVVDDIGKASQYPGVYLMSTNTVNGENPDGSRIANTQLVTYNDFVVVRKGDVIDTVGIYDDHSFDAVVDSVVKACR